MLFSEYVYGIVKANTEGFDAIYDDYIKSLIGAGGLRSLIIHNLVETCGVVNGRQLYVLCEKGERNERNIV